MKNLRMLKRIGICAAAFMINAEFAECINANEYEIVDMWGNVNMKEETEIIVSKNPNEYKEWAVDSKKWKEIFEEPENYPEILLEDLERNPEILEFVYGYPDSTKEVQDGFSEEEKEEVCPLLIQWDARWGYVSYGSYNIGISGCGPTCLSMVLYSFTKDETLTPDFLAEIAMEKGYYVKGTGTSWTFMTEVPKEYGVEALQAVSLEKEKMIETLGNGGRIICSMRPGDFTNTGHFIVVTGYENGTFSVNDPFSYSNSYKKWDFETLEAQAKQVWYYENTKEAAE